ncbi:MAG TPA: hypothetical protein PLW18_01400, partial [Candidatus Dojkabacteria bacterium]|nr:hypothetical protein [Candidatus Dojkabacteria bacterium]
MDIVTAILIIIGISLIFGIIMILLNRGKGDDAEVFQEVRDPVIMQILVPRENDKTPLAAEQMFASIHGILGDNVRSVDLVSFEIESSGNGGIRFYAVVPKHLAKFIEGQIYAQYPNADITYVQDYTLSKEQGAQLFVTTGEIELEKDYIFPIKTFRNFDVDPLAAITGAISDLKIDQSAWIQILVRPVANYWQA